MANFDDRNIKWQSLDGTDNALLSIFSVDQAANTVDFIIKFKANSDGLPHKHLAATHTFVIEGDHVIYETDGSIRESRPTGRYSVGGVTGDIHGEGGGPDGCVLMYSVRGHREELFELLDRDLNRTGIVRVADLQAVFDAQNA